MAELIKFDPVVHFPVKQRSKSVAYSKLSYVESAHYGNQKVLLLSLSTSLSWNMNCFTRLSCGCRIGQFCPSEEFSGQTTLKEIEKDAHGEQQDRIIYKTGPLPHSQL